MESEVPVRRRYFAYSVNQSLLELADKLRQAEVRVNGRTLQTVIPPRNISAGISSTVDGGRFQFIARRNDELENVTPLEYVNGSDAAVTTNSAAEMVTANSCHANDVPEPVHTHSKKLSMPNRSGPSLWPVLSSIKASLDAEHVRFLEKNQKFYRNYDKSRVAEDYIEPLSETDVEIVIDNAIDAVLKTRDSRASQQSRSSRNESCVPAAVSTAPVPVSVNAVQDIPSTFETVNIAPMIPVPTIPVPTTIIPTTVIPTTVMPTTMMPTTMIPTQPAVVSKRYAAAVANPRRFRCGLCPYSTNNRSHVRRHHISVHSDARPYRCYVCSKEFARCENAKVHMISRHPDVPYSVDRLRNNMFFKSPSSASLTEVDPMPSTSIQSSSVSEAAFQLQQDVGSSGMSAQWPNDALNVELNRPQLEHHQAIPPWITFPKIEPNLNPSLPMYSHGNTVSQSLEGIPRSMFQADTNAMMKVQSLLGSGTIKQEPADTKDSGYPLSDRHVCFYCQFVCQNAADLTNHIATSHSSLNPAALHAAPSSNPGYVVLQTAAPIFLLPYGSESVLPNRSQVGLGYHPILPKLPAFSDESRNEASAGQHSSSVTAATTYRSPPNVPIAKAASVGSSSASRISDLMPEKAQESQSPSPTPASSEGKRERKRQFKRFYCSRCPDRAPFRYEKSFEKHLNQHRFEDRSRKAQKIASKVA